MEKGVRDLRVDRSVVVVDVGEEWSTVMMWRREGTALEVSVALSWS